MAFIGNTPTTQAFTPAVDVFSGNGSTTAFTLSRPVASVAQVQAFIENVPQSPVDAFTVSGNTITFTSAPPSGSSNIYVRYTSPITQVIAPSDGTVGTSALAAGAVTVAKLSGSGVPSFDGIKFPASQVASADANTLDDYEEGTFTPTVNLLGTVTYNTQIGRYTKIGRLVNISIYLVFTSTDTTQDSNVFYINGIPFTAANIAQHGTSCAMTERLKGTSSPTAPHTFHAKMDENTANLRMWGNNYNGTIASNSWFASLLRNAYSGATAYIYLNYTFEVA